MLTAFASHPDCLKHETGTIHPESAARLRAIEDHLMESQLLYLLRHLDATSDGRLNDTGRAMARLPVHPRLARMLLEGGNAFDAAVAIAAALNVVEPFMSGITRSVMTRSISASDSSKYFRPSSPFSAVRTSYLALKKL